MKPHQTWKTCWLNPLKHLVKFYLVYSWKMWIVECRLCLLIYVLCKNEKNFKYFGENAKNACGSLESCLEIWKFAANYFMNQSEKKESKLKFETGYFFLKESKEYSGKRYSRKVLFILDSWSRSLYRKHLVTLT